VVGRSSLKVENHELQFSQEVSKLINTVLSIRVLSRIGLSSLFKYLDTKMKGRLETGSFHWYLIATPHVPRRSELMPRCFFETTQQILSTGYQRERREK
jgi:hypothetical protein